MNSLANLYERAVESQAHTADRLNWLLFLMVTGLVLSATILLVQIVLVGRRRVDEVVGRMCLEESKRINDETWELLGMVKDWAGSARINSKETAMVVREVKEHVPVAERQVLAAVAAVPEKTAEITADRVMEKISLKEDSDPLRKHGGTNGG